MKSCPVANHELYTLYEDGTVHSGKLDVLLQARQNSNGYLIVTLDGKQLSVHRLVALHFLPNPYNYSQVNHKDGNKLNNHYSNLEWCTAKQNMQHAFGTGLRKGFIHVNDKRKYLKRILEGETATNLAKEIGTVHPNTLNKMLRNQAISDGLEEQWNTEAKRKRREVAKRNLEKVNAKN